VQHNMINQFGDHCVDMEHPPLQQPEQIPHLMPDSGKGKRKRLRDWTEKETSVLLECVNSPQFRYQKRKQSYMNWDAIAGEIKKRLVQPDSAINRKRCQDRMKTLRGYYHRVRTVQKEANVTEAEWRKSNGLAVDWWYDAIGNFQGPRDGKVVRKQNATKSTMKQTVSFASSALLLKRSLTEVLLSYCFMDFNTCSECM
jgi:gas vesicle protein